MEISADPRVCMAAEGLFFLNVNIELADNAMKTEQPLLAITNMYSPDLRTVQSSHTETRARFVEAAIFDGNMLYRLTIADTLQQ